MNTFVLIWILGTLLTWVAISFYVKVNIIHIILLVLFWPFVWIPALREIFRSR